MAPGVGGVLITVTSWGQFVGVGVFLVYLTFFKTASWVGGTGLLSPGWGQHLGFSRFGDSFLDFGGSFLGWHSEGSSGQLLGVLGGSLEFGRAPVLVKSSQKLKICPIF